MLPTSSCQSALRLRHSEKTVDENCILIGTKATRLSELARASAVLKLTQKRLNDKVLKRHFSSVHGINQSAYSVCQLTLALADLSDQGVADVADPEEQSQLRSMLALCRKLKKVTSVGGLKASIFDIFDPRTAVSDEIVKVRAKGLQDLESLRHIYGEP